MASLWRSRERRESLRDPSHGLSRNLALDYGDQLEIGVFTAVRRAQPITFAIEFEITGASPNGVLFEMGSSTRGCAVWLDSALSEIGCCAGDGIAVPDDGVDDSVPLVISTGKRYKVVFCINMDGKITMWANGKLRVRAQSVNGGFGGGNTWAQETNGQVGAVFGSVNDRVPAASRVVIADASIIGPLSTYFDQLPRHYGAPGILV